MQWVLLFFFLFKQIWFLLLQLNVYEACFGRVVGKWCCFFYSVGWLFAGLPPRADMMAPMVCRRPRVIVWNKSAISGCCLWKFADQFSSTNMMLVITIKCILGLFQGNISSGVVCFFVFYSVSCFFAVVPSRADTMASMVSRRPCLHGSGHCSRVSMVTIWDVQIQSLIKLHITSK